MTVTIGIDLASQAPRTGACVVRWEDERAVIERLDVGFTDAGLLGLIEKHEPVKVGIDAPFGWPAAFVAGLADPSSWPNGPDPEKVERGKLERRATDHRVHNKTTKQPLSVSTDRIAYAAMRAAGLLAHLRHTGRTIDRTGRTGLVCEVYPDPAIRRFELRPKEDKLSYKGAAVEVRRAIVARLRAQLDGVPHTCWDACIGSDDHLDALMCALVARAVQLGTVEEIPKEGPVGRLVQRGTS